MKNVILSFSLFLALTGCGANYFSASRALHYEVSPDGTKKLDYSGNTEFEGLDIDLQEEAGQIKALKVKVAKSGTSDAAIAAAQATSLKLSEILDRVLEQAAKNAAAMGAGS